MKRLEQALEGYLQETLGLQATAAQSAKAPPLPHFLAQLYAPKQVRVNDRLWLGIFLKQGADLKPATFEKHVHQLPWGEAEGYFLVANALPGYVRRRLIERKIPFVVPGSQLYLPQFGMDMRPRWPDPGGPATLLEKMSPATQMVVILAINNSLATPVSPLELARQTGYTAMTMTRAWNELESLELGTQTREGKQRLLSFPDGPQALWSKARAFMQSPVLDTIRLFARDVPTDQQQLAGDSALAEVSMLAAPKVPVYALSREQWKAMKAAGLSNVPLEEPGTCQVQVWRYPPGLTGQHGRVDPFSLYLSLQAVHDERIQSALDEMLEQHSWS